MRRVTSSHVLNCRVQGLKFKTEEQSDLNDILLRVSAFGLFTYAVFSVIAGHRKAFTVEPNLLVMITGILSVFQVSFARLGNAAFLVTSIPGCFATVIHSGRIQT